MHYLNLSVFCQKLNRHSFHFSHLYRRPAQLSASSAPVRSCRHPYFTVGRDVGMTASASSHPSSTTNCRPRPQQAATLQWAALCQPAPRVSFFFFLSFCSFLLPHIYVLSLRTQESSESRGKKTKQSFTTKLCESIISVHCLFFLTTYYYSLLNLLLYGFCSYLIRTAPSKVIVTS